MPEVRRLLCLLTLPAEDRSFHLHWSWWRRTHQAVARRGHIARRARGQPEPNRRCPVPVAQAPTLAPPSGFPCPHAAQLLELTDTHWAQVQALLPAPTGRGRPARHQRRILTGLLWLHQTGASWRDLPECYGRWQTAYSCYRRWCTDDTWPRLLALFTTEFSDVSL